MGAGLSRRFIPDFRQLPRAFWVLFVGTLINRTGGFVFVFLTLYLIEVRDLQVAFTTDPEGRAAFGESSGAAAALTMAWRHPNLYRRVISYSERSSPFSATPRRRTGPGIFIRHPSRMQNANCCVSGCMSGSWKLLADGAKRYVFDLSKDVGEPNDLTNQRQDAARRLRLLIAAWEADVDAEAKATAAPRPDKAACRLVHGRWLAGGVMPFSRR
jgi:S-formylglutathione hydrolase FrmB